MASFKELAPSTDEFYEALLEDNPADLYDNAPCGYLSTSPDGTVVKVNQTFLTWTGFDRAALVGKQRLPELLTAGGKIFYETHIAPMLRMQGRAREIAVEIRCADDARLPVLLNAVVQRDSHGNPTAVRVAVFDATERRAYERELVAARERAEASEARARQLAHTLQTSLIPPELPVIAHLELSAAYRPAGDGSEVGGDFYDVFEAPDGSWIVTIGDVCGKGAEAAVVTSLARYAVRAGAYRRLDPVGVLEWLNELMLRESPDRFCTVAYLRIRAEAGVAHVTSVCAGHPAPLVADAESCVVAGISGTAMGIDHEVELHPFDFTVTPGSLVALYTDGCTEARDGRKQFFGERRLRDLLREIAARGTTDPAAAVSDAVVAYQHGLPRDDIAVVVARPVG